MSLETGNAVFLSYASQDAEAARRICEALRAAGVEVWFDQSELVGGAAWDASTPHPYVWIVIVIVIVIVAAPNSTKSCCTNAVTSAVRQSPTAMSGTFRPERLNHSGAGVETARNRQVQSPPRCLFFSRPLRSRTNRSWRLINATLRLGYQALTVRPHVRQDRRVLRIAREVGRFIGVDAELKELLVNRLFPTDAGRQPFVIRVRNERAHRAAFRLAGNIPKQTAISRKIADVFPLRRARALAPRIPEVR